jgi:hypothetical protein
VATYELGFGTKRPAVPDHREAVWGQVEADILDPLCGIGDY